MRSTVNGRARACDILTDALFKTLSCIVFSPKKLPLTTVIKVLRYFFNFHARLLVLGRGEYARTAMSYAIELVARMLPLNQEETVELKQWLSQYLTTVNSHSGVFTPLHCVCINENLMHRIQIIRLLLEAGANPATVDNSGNPPLHCLAIFHTDYRAAVRLLLEFGARLDQPNAEGETPLDVFTRNKQLPRPSSYFNDIYLASDLKCVFSITQCGLSV